MLDRRYALVKHPKGHLHVHEVYFDGNRVSYIEEYPVELAGPSRDFVIGTLKKVLDDLQKGEVIRDFHSPALDAEILDFTPDELQDYYGDLE